MAKHLSSFAKLNRSYEKKKLLIDIFPYTLFDVRVTNSTRNKVGFYTPFYFVYLFEKMSLGQIFFISFLLCLSIFEFLTI